MDVFHRPGDDFLGADGELGLVDVKQLAEPNGPNQLDGLLQLAVRDQKEPQVGPRRYVEPATLDEPEILLQAGKAAVRLLGLGGLEVDAELLAPEPKRNAERVTTLFEPGHAAPPIVFERNLGVGAIDVTPTQGHCCPQIAPKPGFGKEKRLLGKTRKAWKTCGFCYFSTCLKQAEREGLKNLVFFIAITPLTKHLSAGQMNEMAPSKTWAI